MISNKYNFICICNMRVASQSLSKSLSPYSIYDDTHITANEIKEGKLISPASKRLLSDSEIFLNKHKNWDNYFKFGFIRNPYEHFLSVYMYLKKHKFPYTNNFSSYTDYQDKTNYQSMSDWSFTNLYDRISDENDNIIIDFVGRFENLKDDWDFITNKIGIGKVDLKVI
jgi:hypothetical protein